MSSLVMRASRLLERARWKDEGWDRPDPPEILKRYADESGLHAVHLSDLGPGYEVASPNDPDSDEGPVPRDVSGFQAAINTRAEYNTPIGVYSYPLNDETYKRWFGDETARPPYGNRRDWMYILEVTSRDVLHISARGETRFDDADLERLAVELAARERDMLVDARMGDVPEDPEAITGSELFKKAVARADVQTPFGEMWNFMRMVAHNGGNGITTWTRILTDYLDIDAIFDHGSGIVHDNEPTQAVFLESSAYDAVEVVDNVWEWHDRQKRSDREAHVWNELDAAGLGHIAGDVVFRDMSSKLEVDRGVRVLADNPWLVEMVEGATSPPDLNPWGDYGDEDVVQLSLALDPPQVKNGRFEGVDFAPDMARQRPVTFKNCRFVDCTLGADYTAAVVDKGEPIILEEVEMVDCRFEIPQGAFDEVVDTSTVSGDYLLEQMRTYAKTGEIGDDGPIDHSALMDYFLAFWGMMPDVFIDPPLNGSTIEVV